jgi:hypothetical protein
MMSIQIAAATMVWRKRGPQPNACARHLRIARGPSRAHAEARAEASADRRAEAARPGVIHNCTQLGRANTDLSALGDQVYQRVKGRAPSAQERKKVQALVRDASGAWLSAHPGGFDGALGAAREAVAAYGQNLQGHTTEGGTGSSSSARLRSQESLYANPRVN